MVTAIVAICVFLVLVLAARGVLYWRVKAHRNDWERTSRIVAVHEIDGMRYVEEVSDMPQSITGISPGGVSFVPPVPERRSVASRLGRKKGR